MGNQGTLVCDGHHLKVTNIRANDGQLVVTAIAHGPLLAGGGTVTLFGEDAVGVAQGGDVHWPQLGTDDTVTIRWTIRIAAIIPTPQVDIPTRGV